MSVPRLSALLSSRNIHRYIFQTEKPRLFRVNSNNLSTTTSSQEKYFTPKHEWVEVQGKIGTVGVSKYAADALGDIVYSQLPEPGDSVEAGGEIGALESVKAASEIYSPISGKVMEKNDKVEDGPALINQSPEDEGWLCRIELNNAAELEGLMKIKEYETYLGTLADDH
ncbi:uncharacterized protein LOC111716819 [Eurytemora carolleeae]|uniref:uncharacterized protein LOC111716819 n=1 Tax=Eurytemora carolleeae TaxID=1294199 RepID=UPI000C75B008|nr:uncharacterized protein LOC111716819 [Eurytemora carolleeae]|eukprot:XP_023348080.1 uncharacterized protein LOC111716819 [Eurytemora affinis]